MKLERYISPEYLNSQKQLHELPKGYGGGSGIWAATVVEIARQHNCKTILDYGCGQGKLGSNIRPLFPEWDFVDYDPAIKGKDEIEKYRTFDLVVCTDVLEHVEPNRLGVVIDHLYRLTVKVLFIVVATRPSNKFFKDGRNVHLTIEPEDWWEKRIVHPSFEILDKPRSPHIAREMVTLQRRLR